VKRIVVAGYGPVGKALARQLTARADLVTIAQRHALPHLPAGARFAPADFADAEQTAQACDGADVVVCAVGVPYRSSTYVTAWPVIMRNLLSGCAKARARFVFADNLYMYGPQTRPLTPDMPLTDHGNKPRVRAAITRQWSEAHRSGAVRAVAVRASDFYGPDVETSVISTQGVARLLAGKPALAPYPPDHPHDFTYVPDFARARRAHRCAGRRLWPSMARAERPDVVAAANTLAAQLIGVRPRIAVLPAALAALVGLFKPEVKELAEMRFQWDRPYLVDASDFTRRFGGEPTPFERGLLETISWYRDDRPRAHSPGD
jgi:nucleoside-diphosphate-sugar epimerase